MSHLNARSAMQQYKSMGTQGGIVDASPHRLIQMLLVGALDKIAIAKGHMDRGEIGAKGSHISWAISIIGGLRTSLDPSAGGEIAANLERLYEYIERRLAQANIENSTAMLDEVASLLGQIKSGWDAIAPAINGPQDVPAVSGLSR